MDRKRGIRRRVLTITAFISILYGCTGHAVYDRETEVEICLKSCILQSKSLMPDEEKISDVTLMIFDEHGLLEKHIYMDNGSTSHTVSLLRGNRYSILACANIGYSIYASNLEEAGQISYYLAYPDEYREGIPMAATLHGITINDEQRIDIELERLMARISIRMDRSRLADDVQMDVIGIRIGNCPKRVTLFGNSKVENSDECFPLGFNHNDTACSALNLRDMNGKSEEVSLYMLENMQGNFNDVPIERDEEKVFDEHDPMQYVCSYIEVDLEYRGKDIASSSMPLIYRFYLGDGLNSLDIERNCHYRITISPENDGIHDNSWRVDKSGLVFTGTTKFMQYPGDYINGNIGDRIHIGCSFSPSFAPFDIGLEYLKADREEGIYEYEIDQDGHGVTLILKKPGTGLIYMEAGEPVNEAALFLIEVNQPG